MAAEYAVSPLEAPDKSSVHVIALDDLESPVVRTGANYWRMLRGGRRLPGRADLSPREMRAILKHVVLLRVLDGGADYEYRVAGDAHVQAYGMSFKDMRISGIIAMSPHFGRMMYGLYEHVRTTAEPFAVRGWVGREVADARFVYYESAFLPLGDDGRTVDHIVVVSMYVPRLAG